MSRQESEVSKLYITTANYAVEADRVLRRTLNCIFIKGMDKKLYKVSAHDYDRELSKPIRFVEGVVLDGGDKT